MFLSFGVFCKEVRHLYQNLSFFLTFLFLLLFITVSIDLFSIFITKLRLITEMKQSLEQVESLFVDRDLLTAQQYCIFTGHHCDFSIYCLATVWRCETSFTYTTTSWHYLTATVHCMVSEVLFCQVLSDVLIDFSDKVLI